MAEHHNFQLSEERPAHDQVWREFSNKGLTYREVWNKGDKLKKLRVDADYRTTAVIGAETTVASLKLADRIIECLRQIQHKRLSSQP